MAHLAAHVGGQPASDVIAAISLSRWLTGDRDGEVADYQRLIDRGAAFADLYAVTISNWPNALKQTMLEVLAETLEQHP